MKHWLRERGDRLLRLTIRDTGEKDHIIQLDGKNVSDDTLLTFAKDVASRLQ